jgi:succinate dehydrogenase/fumarate reductase flavoprotein subunit
MADWIHKGETIEELAQKLGLPPLNLKESIERFNKFAKEGLDPDFHRGEPGYDKRWAFFPKLKPNPVLGPLDKPPFYGVQLHVGTVGNLGGLVTNTHGQVLDAEGAAIPGLYATSNAAAPLATGYAYTSGMTGGKAMIFGWAAAIHAAGAAKDSGKQATEVRKAAAGERASVATPPRPSLLARRSRSLLQHDLWARRSRFSMRTVPVFLTWRRCRRLATGCA